MKKAFFVLMLLLGFYPVIAVQAFELSPQAEISLLTASPGDELYSVFGHSAIRVMDPENTLDLVFNYGTFDFNTPNFYLKFSQGRLLYKLSTAPMHYFLREYDYEGRAVYEQVLHMSQEQKQRMFDFLLWNQQPENAYYQYDFFYDNCATRIRDIVDELLGVDWGADTFPEVSRSFRDMLQPYLETMPWSAFGIDLALGVPADKIATPWHFMFLPDELFLALAAARHADGTPLVLETRVVLEKTLPLSSAGFIFPQMVFWLIFLLGLLSFLRPRLSRVFDLAFFNGIGVLGLVVFFLWFMSDHITTKSNLVIFWALPFHLYYSWKASYKRNNRFAVLFYRTSAALALLFVVLWPWNPQAFHAAFFPIILIVGIKSLPYAVELPWLSAHLYGDVKQE